MPLAALYDIHAMPWALDAVLGELERERVDAIVLGGDLAAGPYPLETVERLRGLGERAWWLRGNTDRELAESVAPDFDDAEREATAWIRDQLGAEQLEFLGALSPTQTLEVEGLGKVLFCHATPTSDLEVVTQGTPRAHLMRLVAATDADVVVAGHTHMQLDLRLDGRRWINAGSVGMAYEGEVAAFWALLGPDVSLRRTPFDVDNAAERILASGWPHAEQFVAENVRQAVTREEATAAMEQLAIDRGER